MGRHDSGRLCRDYPKNPLPQFALNIDKRTVGLGQRAWSMDGIAAPGSLVPETVGQLSS